MIDYNSYRRQNSTFSRFSGSPERYPSTPERVDWERTRETSSALVFAIVMCIVSIAFGFGLIWLGLLLVMPR